MKKSSLLLTGVIVTSAVFGITTQAMSRQSTNKQSQSKPLQSVVRTNGRLQVLGNRIVGKDNQPVSLAGMSLFWSQWMPQYYTPEVVSWLKKDWKATVIRAAIAADSGGYLKNPDLEFSKAVTVVDAAIKEGMYVIVDWHDHEAQKHTAQSVKFFGDLSKKYKGRENVIYEIYNEPLKVSWSTVIKPYAEQVIAAIRANDPKALIIVGTPTWSQDVDSVISDPIKDKNVAYTLHFYAGTHKQYLRDKAQKALNAGLALMVTEWGTVNANGDGGIDRSSTEEWIAFMKANQLSMCNWSVADKVESAAVLKPGASGKGNWKESELTESGKYVKHIISTWSVK